MNTRLSNLEMPVTFDAPFLVWLYSPSHSQLLLRSTDSAHAQNTDIVFAGVQYMKVQTMYSALLLQVADESHILSEEISRGPSDTVVLLDSSGKDYVVCQALRVSTNTLGRFEVDFPIPF